jgi:putative restriction endonuclease
MAEWRIIRGAAPRELYGGETVEILEAESGNAALEHYATSLGRSYRRVNNDRIQIVGDEPYTLGFLRSDRDWPVPAQWDRAAAELGVRVAMWQRLHERGGPLGVPKALVRELGIYGGAQGVWVDSERTRGIAGDKAGVAVGLLHTGRHYADDLSPTGILYHYPHTGRPPGRDASEVQATKNAGRFALPVFVITPSPASGELRDVHLGWVADWDDADEIFLVTFTDDLTLAEMRDVDGMREPFKLLDDSPETRRVEVAARPNQQRFKFDVIARYGAACAVCEIDAREVLDAVHIAEKGQKGTDQAENGLVLCATHHRAFDRGLFCIRPDDLVIHTKPGTAELRITKTSITHLKAHPHFDALTWRWSRWAGASAVDQGPAVAR